ncbi:MAG: hypothetical protein HZB45_27450 [Mycolicibacterium rufum]|nr:hypothetical protein [Mycolicibacterium rufum]
MAVLDLPRPAHRLPSSIRCIRRILPTAACGIPARALGDPAVAAWVRAHGITVIVCGDDEVEQVGRLGIRPEHVVLRCGLSTATIGNAVGAGVVRFIVATDRHVDVLTGTGRPGIGVYLDEQAPGVIGERRIDVIGLHCDVDDSEGALEWGVAAERMLCRMSVLRTCGLALGRISVAGGDAGAWVYGTGATSRAATAVDDALTEGCARWRLPRPAALLGPRVG